MNYKSFLSNETYEILMATQNSICFEILIHEFDTLFDYTFQYGPKLNLLTVNIIQGKHVIRIYYTYHIIKNITQKCWGTKTKYEVNFRSHISHWKHPLKINSSWLHLLLGKN